MAYSQPQSQSYDRRYKKASGFRIKTDHCDRARRMYSIYIRTSCFINNRTGSYLSQSPGASFFRPTSASPLSEPDSFPHPQPRPAFSFILHFELAVSFFLFIKHLHKSVLQSIYRERKGGAKSKKQLLSSTGNGRTWGQQLHKALKALSPLEKKNTMS